MLQRRVSPAKKYLRRTLQVVALVGTIVVGIIALVAARVRGGSIRPSGNVDLNVPFFKRYFLGGADSLRGWGRFEVSPLEGGLAIGGLSQFESSLELRAPLFGSVTGVVFADAGNVWADPWSINVAAGSPSEFKFTLSAKSGKSGIVIFKVTNKGKLSHDFSIGGRKTPLISPGKSNTLRVTLKKGSFPYKCTVPGHAAAGMKGVFKVT